MPYEPPPELAGLSLSQIAEAVEARKLPPVDQWSPDISGDSQMHIARDGKWYHQGSEVTRPAMVRAFASLLIRDGNGQHWLMTPYQKLTIEVEDAAFIAVDMQVSEGALAFRLNTDDLVVAGPDNPLMTRGDPETPSLYLAVRHSCEAKLNRSTYAQIAEHSASLGDDWTVVSQGSEFSLVPA